MYRLASNNGHFESVSVIQRCPLCGGYFIIFFDDIRVTCCFLSQALRKLLVYRERQRIGLKDQKVFIQYYYYMYTVLHIN